jgi:D-alanine-D-alanine ligase
MQKIKAVVLYGGRSTEHEVSCRSASFLFRHIDRQRYEVFPIAIDKDGNWLPQDRQRLEREFPTSMPVDRTAPLDPESQAVLQKIFSMGTPKDDLVIFNIIHGTFGEDGCLQGFFDLQGIAYVGPGILGSAIAMDKVVAKQLVAAAGIPIVPYVSFRAGEWREGATRLIEQIQKELTYPVFVKPASLGSSVGVHRVKDPSQLVAAVEDALRFDERILVETGFRVREIEYACLGAYKPEVSLPGEVGVAEGFYSYEEKYSQASKAQVLVPAPLEASLAAQGKTMAGRIFEVLNLYGMARIDVFLNLDNQTFYFNEANTLPGFTSISQYPKLWEHSGVPASDLVARLLQLALDRRNHLNSLTRSVP